MGCTDSSIVAENPNKIKPLFTNVEHSNQSDNFLLGEIEQGKSILYNITFSKQTNQPLQFAERSLPKLVNFEGSSKIKLPNFGQLTRIGSSSLYILTGGISYKLDHIYNDVYLLNNKTNNMYKLSSLQQARYTHSALFVGPTLYILGGRYFGEDHVAILNKCQRIKYNFDLESSDEAIQKSIIQSKAQWQQIQPMQIRRCSHITTLYNNRIYVIGGYTGEYERSTIIQYYSLKQKQNKWLKLNVGLPFGIQSFAVIANNNNQLTIFGGNSDSGPMDSVLTLSLLEGYESIRSNRKLRSAKILHKIYQQKEDVYILGGTPELEVELYQINSGSQEQKILQNNSGISKKITYKKILSKYFTSQEKFQSLTHSGSTTKIPFNDAAYNFPYEKSEDDEIAYVFGTSNEPFILQLNITAPYAHCHPMPLSIKLYALQGVIYVVETKEYLLFGGISDSQEDVNSQTYLFNPQNPTKKSRPIGKMAYPRYAFGYKRVKNWVYAIGGGSADEQGELCILNKCQRLNLLKLPQVGSIESAEWNQIADLPIGLISPMTINHKENLYVFGGMKSNKQRYQHILKFNQKQNKWGELKFNFSFGLEASSIYHKTQNQYLIFGGRVVNGDTKSIWGLTFISDGQDCVFEEKGQMKQAKCLHNAYKPKHQDFIIILGGQKQVLSFYDCASLKPIQSDILSGMKRLFTDSLATLSDRSLKNYTIAIKQ